MVDNTRVDIDDAGFDSTYENCISIPKSHVVSSVSVGGNSLTLAAAHFCSVDDGPFVVVGDDPPAGLAEMTPYWIQAVPDATSVKLAATKGGAAIDITDAGSGSILLRAPSVVWRDTAQGNKLSRGLYYSTIYNESPHSQCYDHISVKDDVLIIDAATIGEDRKVWIVDDAGSKKRWTRGALPEFADNAAALIGGLEVGDEYRTGAAVKVVI